MLREPLNNIRERGASRCSLDRVVVRSRSQIVKPDALFVVFLGIKWAHDIVKKIDHEFMGIFGPEMLAFFTRENGSKRAFFKIGL